MPKFKSTGLNSPAQTKAEIKANCGGMPPTKDVKQIDKQNTPPKNAPGGADGKSVRF